METFGNNLGAKKGNLIIIANTVTLHAVKNIVGKDILKHLNIYRKQTEAIWKHKGAKKGKLLTCAVTIVIKNLKHVLDYGNILKHVILRIKQRINKKLLQRPMKFTSLKR